MVKQNIRRVMAFVCAAIIIAVISKCQTVETSWHRADNAISTKRDKYTKDISLEELNTFIKHWPEFSKLVLKNNIDLSAQNASQNLNWKMKLWFIYHHWEAQRFFYVRQRLIKLLEEIKVRREAQNIIAHLQKNKEVVASQMIELQKKRIQSQDITPNELVMLTSKENELRKMFKQYP